MVKFLLVKNGVGPDSKKINGRTPLPLAAESGHKPALELLLGKDEVNSNFADTVHQKTLLSWASENDHEEVVTLLLGKNCVDPDSKQ